MRVPWSSRAAFFFSRPRPIRRSLFLSFFVPFENSQKNSPRGGPPDQAPAQLPQAPVRDFLKKEKTNLERERENTKLNSSSKTQKKIKHTQRLPLCQRQQRRRGLRRRRRRRGHPGLALRVRGLLGGLVLRWDLLDFRRRELILFSFFFSLHIDAKKKKKKLIFLFPSLLLLRKNKNRSASRCPPTPPAPGPGRRSTQTRRRRRRPSSPAGGSVPVSSLFFF